MKFGVCVPNYGDTSSVEAVSAIALEAEALGYDSVWTTDHVLMPRNSGTPYERILDSSADSSPIWPLRPGTSGSASPPSSLRCATQRS